MTGAWLDRLVEPGRFLAPSPRERAEELLGRLTTSLGGDWLEQWRDECDSGSGYFRVLLRLLFAASHAGHGTDDSVAALELITRLEDDAPVEAFNNLVHAYLIRGDLDQGQVFLQAALRIAPRNPSIYYNAACLLARQGDNEQALAMCVAAREHGYENMAKLRADEDLRALRDDARFTALFDAPAGTTRVANVREACAQGTVHRESQRPPIDHDRTTCGVCRRWSWMLRVSIYMLSECVPFRAARFVKRTRRRSAIWSGCVVVSFDQCSVRGGGNRRRCGPGRWMPRPSGP
jgi:hypothetical protein